MVDDNRLAAERLAVILVDLFEQASDAARSCEQVARLKQDAASAAAFRSAACDIERAAACARSIRDNLVTYSTATPPFDSALQG
jgi:hypothetical protein